MDGSIIGFIVWALFGCFMIGLGIRAFFSKKAVGFWTNIKTFPVNDIRGYNRATGKLFITYGFIFIVLGVPLLSGQNLPYILLSVLGVMIETIAMMAFYGLSITKNIKKNRRILICICSVRLCKRSLEKRLLHDGDETSKSWKPLLNTILD